MSCVLAYTMASSDQPLRRLTFQEAMELAPLSNIANSSRRFMSRRGAWLPGSDLEDLRDSTGPEAQFRAHDAAFGGHVYSQSVLAICRMIGRETKRQDQNTSGRKSGWASSSLSLGLHVNLLPPSYLLLSAILTIRTRQSMATLLARESPTDPLSTM